MGCWVSVGWEIEFDRCGVPRAPGRKSGFLKTLVVKPSYTAVISKGHINFRACKHIRILYLHKCVNSDIQQVASSVPKNVETEIERIRYDRHISKFAFASISKGHAEFLRFWVYRPQSTQAACEGFLQIDVIKTAHKLLQN